MSDPDHTKSLLHYRDILEAHEEEYRGSTTEGRPDIINLISEDIKKAAVKKGANITEGDTLHKVCGELLGDVIHRSYIPIANHQLLCQPQISSKGR